MVLSRISILSALLISLILISGCNTGFGRSTDNSLSGLTIRANNSTQALTPSFSSDVTNYTRTVGRSTDTISIEAKAEHELATMTLQGVSIENDEVRELSLNVGENRISIVVTAENERKRTYTVVVTRDEVDSSDADLSSLVILNGELNQGFSSSRTEYDVDATALQGSLVIVAEFHEQANANVDGDQIFNGESFEVVLGGRGENIDINVTAGDGTPETYIIDVSLTDVDGFGGRIFRPTVPEDQNNLTEIDKLDDVGSSVAFNDKYFALGASGENGPDVSGTTNAISESGAVFIHSRTGAGRDFVKTDPVTIRAQLENGTSDTLANARFGQVMDMTDEFLIVGAPSSQVDGTAISGKVYIYELNSTTWEIAKVLTAGEDSPATDEFGYSVSIDENILVVGAPGLNQAFIYEYDDGWDAEPSEKLELSSGTRFGHAVSVNTYNGTQEAVVGDEGDNNQAGVAYYYRKQSNSWSEGEEINASAPHRGDGFGAAVILSDKHIVIGAPGEDFVDYGVSPIPANGSEPESETGMGAVYIFNRNDEDNEKTWVVNPYYLKPSGIVDKNDADYSGSFGEVMAMAAGTIVIGYPAESSASLDNEQIDAAFSDDNTERDSNTPQQNSGAVFLFTALAGQEEGWSYRGMFKATSPDSAEQFGSSVYLYKGELAVGAPKENGTDGDNTDAIGAGYIIR